MPTVSVLNTSSNLSGKTLLTAEVAATISALLTFSRSPSAPFAVAAASAVVSNLDADKLDGQEGSYYQNASNLNAGTVAVARLPGSLSIHDVCQGRLTLTTALPVTTSDVTAAGTIYFTPYQGNHIGLYDGVSAWTLYEFSELSLALTATSGKPYDVFVYDNAGTPTLETLVWTNDTTRATALVRQNGVLVKSGATTRRYVGSFYATGANQTEDSFAKRNVWNYYNRVDRPGRVLEATNTWAYSAAAWQQANASAANQLECMVGVAEDAADISVYGQGLDGAPGDGRVSIGLDGVSGPATGCIIAYNETANTVMTTSAHLRTILAAGRHTLTWLEYGGGTWWGDNGGTITQSGIHGMFRG